MNLSALGGQLAMQQQVVLWKGMPLLTAQSSRGALEYDSSVRTGL